MQLRSLFLFAALIAGFPVSRTLAADQVFEVAGVIRAPLADGRLVIAHDDIPGFMPAMTMAFTVANPADAASLKPGDKVRFQLRVGETASTVGDFKVSGHEAPAVAAKPTTATRGRLREGDAVPQFSFIDQDSRPFASAEFRGRLTVLTFIFTRCPVPEYCPAMALRFAQLQKAIASDPKLAANVRLLSITLDPEFDRPDILKAYGQAVGADPTIWRFATGGKDEVAALVKSFAVFTERNGATLDHTLCTALIGGDGRVVEIWRGNGWRAADVLTTITRVAGE
jgi:protein SCO1/2